MRVEHRAMGVCITVAAVALGAAVPGGGGRVPLGVDHPVRRPRSLPGAEEAHERRCEEHRADGEAVGVRGARGAGGHGAKHVKSRERRRHSQLRQRTPTDTTAVLCRNGRPRSSGGGTCSSDLSLGLGGRF